MSNVVKLLLAASLLAPATAIWADEPTVNGRELPKDELTPEALALEKELKATLPKGSEALAMLEDILNGRTLGPEDGWFPLAKSQTRFDWSYVGKRYDTNSDQSISPSEFSGSQQDFERLDRNQDGSITELDFDWTKHSLDPTPGYMMFFKADQDANGKVTQAEFLNLFTELASGEKEYLALDDLRDQFLPPPPGAREKRRDRPNRSTLIQALKNQELGSLQPGPNLNDVASDFTLTALDGKEVTLTQAIRDKPVVLIFGNFTCGPFRSQSANIEKLYERYRDRAIFFLVYVREAHPSDGWWMISNQKVGIDFAQPQDLAARRNIASTCQKLLDLHIPLLVDNLDDQVGSTYSGMPNRLYLIDTQGRIAFKNGRGPFGFHPRQLEQALVLLLHDSRPTPPDSLQP